MKQYFIYMVTNKGRSTLYIRVTNSLMRRMFQHRQGEIPGFSKRYNTNRLVYYEQHNDVQDAIAGEKQLKGWSGKKKKDLVNNMNPSWTWRSRCWGWSRSRRGNGMPAWLVHGRSLDKLGMTEARITTCCREVGEMFTPDCRNCGTATRLAEPFPPVVVT